MQWPCWIAVGFGVGRRARPSAVHADPAWRHEDAEPVQSALVLARSRSAKAIITSLLAVLLPFLGGVGPSVASDEIGAEILGSFPVPGSSPTGLAWDGTSLWMVDNLKNLYQLNSGGTVLKTCEVDFSISDLTWDGLNLWALKDSSGPLVALDRGANCGQVLGTLLVGYWPGSGSAWDGSYFWVGNYNDGVIHKHDSAGNEILNFDTGLFGHPTGMSYDGTDLLIGDSFELYNRVYKYSKTGIEKAFVDIDKLGLARVKMFEKKVLEWDGANLWYTTDGRFEIYKIGFLAPGVSLNVSRYGIGTIASAPAGIICGPTCSASFTSGANVTLTATPSSGYSFSGWSGGCSGTGTCAVTMDTAKSVTATFSLTTVNAPVLSSLSIGGGSSVLAAGGSMTLSASAGYSDGSSRAVTASWSANSAAVSVSLSGQVTAAQVSVNTPATVTASYTEGGVARTASLNLTVTSSTTPRVTSISIQGSSAVPEGGTTTLRVIATYSDASTKSVSANWSSSNPSLVSVAATGALTVGQVSVDTTVTLTASYTEGGVAVTSAFLLTVKDVPNALSFLIVVGASSLPEGQTSTLTAKANYTDGSSKSVTPIWSSSNSAVASVSASGVVTAFQVTADSSVTITATYSEAGVSKTALFPIVVKDIAAVVISTTPALATGYSHSIALRNDGSVWSWGWSSLGQSGSGETKTRSAPVWVSGIDSITSISAGAAHNLALKVDGTVWAWGLNGQGGLGDGSTDDRQTPIQVAGVTGAKALAAGLYHSLALKSDGAVVAWGSNSNGQLADASGATVRLTPTPVAGLTAVTAIAAGYNSSLALKSDGTIVAWGDIDGSGTNNLYAPVPIGQISGVRALAAGWFHSLALKTDGTVWAWGNNAQGQLGDGTTSNRATPVQVGGITDVKAIAVGFNHSAAIKNDGSVWTWGGNARGQLGNRTASSQPTPQAVTDLTDAIAVAAGNDYTIALKSDGSVWGAGDNLLGQLGDGSFVGSRRFSPVQDADQAKLFDLAPNQAKSPVPADQVPIFYMNSEKSGDEVLSALGSLSSLSLKSRIRHNSGFAASDTYQLFIAVLVPSGRPGLTGAGIASVPVGADTLFFKNAAANWETYGGGTLPVYISNVAASEVDSIAMDILANTDLSRMSGAQFYVGYGTTAEEMVAAGRYRVVYQVP